MSISIALSSALSGLTATGRASEVISSNVANALTEGYGRREISLSARVVGTAGQGVRVNGIIRHSNRVLLNDRRVADASTGDKTTRETFFKRLESTLGLPNSASSLSGRIATFDQALIAASSRPDSEAQLATVAEAARQLVGVITSTANDVQDMRSRADKSIAAQVDLLNETLEKVSELNTQIRANTGAGRDPSALIDQRQQLIDQISAIVPVREIEGDMNMVKLYTPMGATLLDGHPAVFGYDPVGLVAPQMTLQSGALSGLTINGVATDTAGTSSAIAGGSLAANFALRDETGPEAQRQLDALARDLVERFQDPAVDPTLAVGDAGLFTDAGSAFDSAFEIGLAQRLRLNAAVDPQQGGALWRLRDGMGAAAPGSEGDSTLLNALNVALNQAREPASGNFMAGARSFSVLVGDYVSSVATSRLAAESDVTFSSSKAEGLKMMELENGVDTDQEMQKLLLVEQAYQANAKIISMIDQMIKTLMEL